MKKTLLTLAAITMALVLNAQGTWKAPDALTFDPSVSMPIGITGLVVMHNDGHADKVTSRGDAGSPVVSYNGVTWDNEFIVQGNTNGMAYAITPSTNGTLDVALKMGSGKQTWVLETSATAATVTATLVTASMKVDAYTSFPDIAYPTVTVTAVNASGPVPIASGIYDGSVGFSEELRLVLSFPVTAGKTYVVGCQGSKLMLRGINYTTGTTAVSTPATLKEVQSVNYFSILGKEVPATTKGLVFVKTLYKDGTTDVQKFYKK
ncbi:MAG: hypothetical protein LBN23_01575 [Paludibacter sp.]|jgi:hypothetical protein|nr:hypothetical protein [Paludibacter sp.]